MKSKKHRFDLLATFVLAAITAAMPAAAQDAPAGTIALLSAELGTDPADQLAWVAARIAPEGYRGALRGAEGTLRAGAGSSADQALLLAELIHAADPGQPIRFAVCRLPTAHADALAAAAAAASPARAEPLIQAAARLAGDVRDPEARQVAERLASRWREAVATVADQTQSIAAALHANGVSFTAPVIAAADLRQRVADHVWLQLERAGRWIDLDPTLDGAPGEARCAAETTSADFPDALLHRIRIELVLEERAAGSVESRTILDWSSATARLSGGSPALFFAEPLGLHDRAARPASAPAGYSTYTPVLSAADAATFGEPFALPAPSLPGQSMAGALGDVLDLFGSPGDEPMPASDDNVAALWLRVSVSAPGEAPETAVTPLFDRVGYVARANGSESTAPLAALPEADGEYFPLAGVWSIQALTGAPHGAPVEASPDDVDALPSSVVELHATFEALRGAVYASVVGPDAPRFTFLQPGASLLAWIPGAAGDVPSSSFVMDLLIDPSRRLNGDAADRSPELGWAVSTVMGERLVVGMPRLAAEALGEEWGAVVEHDVLAVFDAARGQGVPLAWLAPGDPLSIIGSDEARARVHAHLASGKGVLVPQRSVSLGAQPVLGWWVVDQRAGVVRDEFENGRHQSLTERPVTTQPARAAAPAQRDMGRRIVCTITRAVGIVSLVGGAYAGDPAAAKAGMDLLSLEQKIAEAIAKNRAAGASASDAPGIGCQRP